jgi:hypothetical protein
MRFDRSAVQTFFESKVGCANPLEFSNYLDALTAIVLNLEDSNALIGRVQEDIQGQFERCALTLMQALVDISQKNYLWSAVKLYYATFYALRVELHLNGLSIVRCNQVFTTDAKRGSILKKFNNREKGDHGIAISLMTKKLAPYDIMQGATIDELDVYLWMKRLREIVQYKMRRPPELIGYDPFFPANEMDIRDQVSLFLADTEPYFCFDPDYAALAIPIKRLQLTAANVKLNGISLTNDFTKLAIPLMDKTAAGKLLKPLFW